MIECDNMKDNKGQALVEFVIILPILLIIIMAIVDFGNIFIKKYSLENDIDIISNMYIENKKEEILDYIKEKNININYKEEDDFIIIEINKSININTPLLNTVLGKNYKISTSKAIYE